MFRGFLIPTLVHGGILLLDLVLAVFLMCLLYIRAKRIHPRHFVPYFFKQ
jgi:hypothetical protein